jgi:hypothetical protein
LLLAGLVAVGWQLTRDGTELWQSAVTGAVVGGIRRGWRGAVVGAPVGLTLGVVAAHLYVPLWLVFDLPPCDCDL